MSGVSVSYEGSWRVLHVVLLGQLVSLAMALMSFNASLSANLGVHAPFTLSFFSYLALTLVFGSLLLYRRQKLQISWYWYCWRNKEDIEEIKQYKSAIRYVLLAAVDVQGGFFVNKAYQFSSITSVTILNCWAVVWVILLTRFFLGTKYSVWQIFGAGLCVAGLCLVVLSDSGVEGGGGSNPVLGDVLVIAGTCFFAVSNVGEEFCVKKIGQIEVLTMLGLFGMLVSMIEMAIFERKNLEAVSWSWEAILTFGGYAIASFSFSLVLKASGAMLFNLSLLTADMWAVVIRVFLYHQKVEWLYYVSVLVVGVGLVVNSKTEKHSRDEAYQQLPEESVESGSAVQRD